jgi:hypothetical protein
MVPITMQAVTIGMTRHNTRSSTSFWAGVGSASRFTGAGS